ncbi:MAG TPA: hypothetical protein VFH49_02270 [Aquabacterium sp.]|nr:hypothetical protein [Aquabacterium sp.]
MTTPETQTRVATKKVTAVKKAPMVAKKVAVAKKAPAAKKAPVARKLVPQSAAKTVPPSVAQTAVTTKPGKKKDKVKDAKVKIVRDSFTMPEADFALIDRIKLRAIEWKHPVKKSEVLRAALQALQALPDARVKALLSGLADIKKGRPKKSAG